jgi:hypothetical protein
MRCTVTRTSRRLVLSLIVGVALLGLVPGGAQAQSPPTWSGTWADQSYGGEFQLTQNGTDVRGSYTFCGGSITGTVTGNTLHGTWNQANPGCNPTGWFSFTLNAPGSEFSGVWGYPTTPPSTPAGSWSGRCTAGACLQNGAPTPAPAPPPGTPGSCGSFAPFDPANPPGLVRLEPGDAISYTLDPGDATLKKQTRIRWGDRTSDSLRADLTAPDTFEWIHIYYESGTYRVRLTVVGILGTACNDRVNIGTVVIPPPTRPLAPAVAARKCDDFLRKAGGRAGRIIQSATSQPRTSCGAAQGLRRTCTTTVVDRRRCRCRHRIKTKVPASGKPKVLSITQRRL